MHAAMHSGMRAIPSTRSGVIALALALGCTVGDGGGATLSGGGSASASAGDTAGSESHATATSSGGDATDAGGQSSDGGPSTASDDGSGDSDSGASESSAAADEASGSSDGSDDGEASSSGGGGDLDDGILDVTIIAHDDCTITTMPASITVPEGTEFTVNWISSAASEVEVDVAKIDPFNAVPIILGMEPGSSYHDEVRAWCGALFTGTFDFEITSCYEPQYIPVDCGG